MSNAWKEQINDEWILQKRGSKNNVDPNVPYAYIIEKEYMHTGLVEDVITIFLTNRECPFKCLICDLWKNTTDEKVLIGAIPVQIQYALNRLPKAKHLKLYNSGNFFDTKAIPLEDYEAIIELINGFETLIIECHPKLINARVVEFNSQIKPDLQVAMGLETVHPEILPLLNKRMTTEEFKVGVQFLSANQILTRSFILLGLPFLSENESIDWAMKSIDFAFEAGVECCSVIPTRPGNGALDMLGLENHFQEPSLSSLVEVVEYGISLRKGRVFGDTWDLERFVRNGEDLEWFKSKLEALNFHQV